MEVHYDCYMMFQAVPVRRPFPWLQHIARLRFCSHAKRALKARQLLCFLEAAASLFSLGRFNRLKSTTCSLFLSNSRQCGAKETTKAPQHTTITYDLV
jgi:hypothetical protein